MATSSITEEFIITDEKVAERFLDAIEKLKNNPFPLREVRVRYLQGSEDMEKFWRRREELNGINNE